MQELVDQCDQLHSSPDDDGKARGMHGIFCQNSRLRGQFMVPFMPIVLERVAAINGTPERTKHWETNTDYEVTVNLL